MARWIGVRRVVLAALVIGAVTQVAQSSEDGFVPLFPNEGAPEGWSVRTWNDLSKPVDSNVKWLVKDGVLHGSPMRGTWL
ncbi:MAG: hypothetical protein GXX98_18005, partial [Planctomycetes bacterium]|nr:hypothetical protein [Planctomycetota bacterium]